MVSKRKRSRLEALAKSNDIKGFLEEFQKESDRATAILGAAYLDEHLLQLLSTFLVDDEGEVGELLGTEKPLGTFGARIRAAYCMGLLAKEDFEDLKIIKAIRNDFAHQLHGLSFNGESIVKKCEKLRAVKRLRPNSYHSSREMFVFTTTYILMELCVHSIMFEEKRCQVPSVTEVVQSLSV